MDTLLATPTGFCHMADIHPGDNVLGRDGCVHTVLAESEPEYASAWQLTFDDGAAVIAHDEHLWQTFDASELAALTRRTEAWRAARRERRASRAAGRRSPAFSAAVTERNRNLPPPTQAAPIGTVRTTAQLVATLRLPNGRANHAIAVAAPLDLPERSLPLDPYVLGVWLGDGVTALGKITTMDGEVVDAVVAAGYPVAHVEHKPQNRASTYRFSGLIEVLRTAGVLGNKHIPNEYLWASSGQRLALLQGLMDTDGTVARSSGAAEFTNTNRALSEGVAHLFRSLGHKARVREGRATLRGRDCGPKWTVKVAAKLPVFRLARKLALQTETTRRTTDFRYLLAAERVEPRWMKCIKVSAPDGLYLVSDHFVPTHNSDALLMAALEHVDVPGYAALLFRRTFQDLNLPGALMDRAGEWLRGSDARWNGQDKRWIFPTGATLTFGYLEHENDKYRYQGAAAQFIGFDELTQFSETQYRYLFSRLRRLQGSQVPLRVRSASNPGGLGHDWVFARFIEEDADHSRAFVSAKLDDNPHLDRAEYLLSLGELDPLTRAQLEKGDWRVRPGGKKFKREWFTVIDAVPAGMRAVRFWDLAATEAKEGKDPDWTAGVKIAEREGVYYVLDAVRTRAGPGDVEKLVRQTAEGDGSAVWQFMEQEPGASGVNTIDNYARKVLKGYAFTGIRTTGDKELRANPLSSAAQAENVKLLRGPWNGAYLDELHAFPTKGVHDDQVDASSGAFAQLNVPQAGFAAAVDGPRPPLPKWIR